MAGARIGKLDTWAGPSRRLQIRSGQLTRSDRESPDAELQSREPDEIFEAISETEAPPEQYQCDMNPAQPSKK